MQPRSPDRQWREIYDCAELVIVDAGHVIGRHTEQGTLEAEWDNEGGWTC